MNKKYIFPLITGIVIVILTVLFIHPNKHNLEIISKNNINSSLPPPVHIDVSLMRKDRINLVNLAWIQVLKTDYQRGDKTPVNQTEQHCVQPNRPKGEKIWLPEVCYMIPIEMRNNHNQRVAGDILLLGKDDIISMEPKYKEGNNIIAKIEISQPDGAYNSIPYAVIKEESYLIISNMMKEVTLLLQGKKI